MFCKKCGKELPETARFCDGCGAPVSAEVEYEEKKKEQDQKAESKPVKKNKHTGLGIAAAVFCGIGILGIILPYSLRMVLCLVAMILGIVDLATPSEHKNIADDVLAIVVGSIYLLYVLFSVFLVGVVI